jgi:hypothetical protein
LFFPFFSLQSGIIAGLPKQTPAASNRRTPQNELPAISRDPNVIGAGCKAPCAHGASALPDSTQDPSVPSPYCVSNSGDARQPSIPGAGPACRDQWADLAKHLHRMFNRDIAAGKRPSGGMIRPTALVEPRHRLRD